VFSGGKRNIHSAKKEKKKKFRGRGGGCCARAIKRKGGGVSLDRGGEGKWDKKRMEKKKGFFPGKSRLV